MKYLRGLRPWHRAGIFAGLLLVALALAAGLSRALNPPGPAAGGGTATSASGVISRQQAVAAAIRIGSESRPEMNGSAFPPRVVDARQTTLLQALGELGASASGVPQGEDPNLAVWLLRMDGSWLDGAPRTTEMPIPAAYPHLTVILNGKTGELMLSSTGPPEPQPTLGGLPPAPPGTDEGTAAQSALELFLGSLAAGPADPTFYQRAAALYGGSWAELIEVHPDNSYDHTGLLKNACEQRTYRCLTVRQVSPPEAMAGKRYRLWVQFNQNDGSLYWDLYNGTTWFDFEVLSLGGGQFRVLDLPPDDRGSSQVVAHLRAAETAALDEAGILLVLWEEFMQRCQSAYLPENQRILDYEIVSVTAGSITFSVRPAKMMYSNWVAGNGEMDGDWIRNKSLAVKVFEEGGIWHLKILGSSASIKGQYDHR